MKILISADPFIPVPPTHYGGIERIIDRLIHEYRKAGHTLGLIAHHDSKCDTDAFFAWPAAETHPGWWQHSQTILQAARSFQPDVFHSFSRMLYLYSLIFSDFPIIQSYQRHVRGRQFKVAASAFHAQLQFTGCSEFIAAQGRQLGGQWSAIPNFVDLDSYQFQAEVAADAPLVFLGRIENIKGPDLAIQIAKQTGRRLIIAGNVPDESEHQNYFKHQIKPHLKEGHVEYIGPVDDHQKNKLLGSAAALVCPIRWDEPFGIVFIEALACGTPVISSPRGALPEIASNPATGALIHSLEEGVQSIRNLHQFDRHTCRKIVEEKFSSSSVSKRYLSLYQERLQYG